MPELPEVETVVQGLKPRVLGRTIESAAVLWPGVVKADPAWFVKTVAGREIADISRRGKLILMRLDPLLYLVFHLKMTGGLFTPAPDQEPDPHVRLVFELDRGERLFFKDMRKFGYCMALSWSELSAWPFYAELGPEPLEIGPDEFVNIFQARKGRIKSLLLNQKLIAGIGNIYADESLFRAGIHPEARGTELCQAELLKLHRAVQDTLRQGIEAGGASIRDYRNARGEQGWFQTKLQVYSRKDQPCPCCGETVRKINVGGRSSCFCPKCQPCKD